MKFLFLYLFTLNILFGTDSNNKIIKELKDIDLVLNAQQISRKLPLIFVFDNGIHGKKVISIIKKTLSQKKINLQNNILLINRTFSKNELSDIEIITYLSKKFSQHIFINISYGYQYSLPSKYVTYKNNNYFTNKVKDNFSKKVQELKNITIYKSYGNYIVFDDKLLNMKKSTKEALSAIYQHLCGGNYAQKLKLSKYIRNYLYKVQMIDIKTIVRYIEKNIIFKSNIDINVVKNLVRYSIVELFSQSRNNLLMSSTNIKLVEAVNYNSIYDSYQKSKKHYPRELKNDMDTIYIEFIKSDSLDMRNYNFSYIDKTNNFIQKYKTIYPELFLSVYENYTTLDINTQNILSPEGQALKIKYENVNELLNDKAKRFRGTSAATPQALAYGVIDYLCKE